MNSIKTPKVS